MKSTTVYKVGGSTLLEVMPLVRETKHSVWVQEKRNPWGKNPQEYCTRMYHKNSTYYNFFKNKQAAIKFLHEQNTEQLQYAKDKYQFALESHANRLKKIKSL